jgi:hypothetical protein
MRKWTILAIGFLMAIVGRVSAQETLTPPAVSSAPMISDYTMPNDGPFAPTSQDYWVTADYLFGWMKGDRLPHLVTTSPATVTDPTKAGVLGQSTTSVLLQGLVNQDSRSGVRLGFGYVFDQDYGQAIEAGFIYLPGQETAFGFNSAQHPILALPYTDVKVTPNVAAATLIAFPGQSTGSINVDTKSGGFYGVNLGLSERVWEENGMRLDALLGYRFAAFNDTLRIASHINELAPNPGTMLSTIDQFKAQNVFNGLDMGARTTFAWNNLSLGLLGKVAVGNMNRTVNIHGSQVVTVAPAAPDVRTGGMYALKSNSGRHNDGEINLLPEIGANLSWQMRQNVALRVGYSAIFLNQIARADDQIDFKINPDLLPPGASNATPNKPSYHEVHSQLWIQTLNLGVDFKF